MFFFFKQKTAYEMRISDWSSDVCSSDLTTSPVISASRDAIEKSGRTNLGEYIRDLPQNFNGGQNPGVVGGGTQGGSENLASTSTLNLRGLGPDAKLTLTNGPRKTGRASGRERVGQNG